MPKCIKVFIFLSIFIYFHSAIFSCSTHAFIIVPPSSKQDWDELATLLVETFDEPNIRIKAREKDNGATYESLGNGFLSELRWNYLEKKLTEQYTYNRYVKNSRKMIGKKYALYLAKQRFKNEKDLELYKVVGVVEVGMAKSISSRPRPTLGVIAVKDNFRSQGIGEQLLSRCQDVVANVWQEDELYVQVEPSNTVALQFFQKNDFRENGEIVQTKVSYRRSMIQLPHLVLRKKIDIFKSSPSCND